MPQLHLWINKINSWHLPSLWAHPESQGNKTTILSPKGTFLEMCFSGSFSRTGGFGWREVGCEQIFFLMLIPWESCTIYWKVKKKNLPSFQLQRHWRRLSLKYTRIFSRVNNINACCYFWYCLNDRNGGRSGSSKKKQIQKRQMGRALSLKE